jgi:hypothetical protein
MTGDVTVVICTRNGLTRGYLYEALRSVYEQTSAPSEVLLVDDGSTDDTAAEVRRTYSGVSIVKNTGTGLAAARNTGIEAARNEWIAFIDDDDIWCKTKLSEQLSQIESTPKPESTIFAARTATIEKTNGNPVPHCLPTQYATWPACLVVCPIMPSGVMLSRELLRRIGPFREHTGAGSAYEYWVRCLSAGAVVRFSANILVHYRRHPLQMSRPSSMLTLQHVHESLVLPYIQGLPPALAARIKTARMLRSLRGLAWSLGLSPAARFWAETLLRPAHFDFRTLFHFLLDSAAASAPNVSGRLLRDAAIRLLIADYR